MNGNKTVFGLLEQKSQGGEELTCTKHRRQHLIAELQLGIIPQTRLYGIELLRQC